MPHTNRKPKYTNETPSKPRVATVRRKEIEDDNGWTHIVGSSKVPRQVLEAALGAAQNSEMQNVGSDFRIQNQSYVNRTVEEMERDHEIVKSRWKGNAEVEGLKRVIAGIKGIDNVVCLGLGSMQNCWTQRRNTSHAQLAALMTLVDAIGKTCPHISLV